jgi:hypothetical protein
MRLRGKLAFCSIAIGLGCASPPPQGGSPATRADAVRTLATEPDKLYEDIASKRIAAGVLRYAPEYPLWSDGLVKQRYLFLPPGTKIDTRDMDHWRFPVGTRFYKEFAAPTGKLIETRIVQKVADGDGDDDFFMASFVWNQDDTDATLAVEGARVSVPGLGPSGSDLLHQVPAAIECRRCHAGEPGRVLGFSAVQLPYEKPGAIGVDLERLRAAELLSQPPPEGKHYQIPGNDATRAALGYFHGNCGHCHNNQREFYAGFDLHLRISTAETGVAPEATQAYKTTVGKPTKQFQPGSTRLKPGEPDDSEIPYRMAQRASPSRMPPMFATREVDPAGLAAIKAFVKQIPKPKE